MHWCFLDPADIDYTPLSLERAPLGGTTTMVCSLTRLLAKTGHKVTLVCNTSRPGLHGGVETLAWKHLPDDWAERRFDRVVGVNAWQPAMKVIAQKRYYWNHQAEVQTPAELAMSLKTGFLSGIICVSAWQREQLLRNYHLPAASLHVIPNAVAPLFNQPHLTPERLLAAKAPDLELIYTSVPIRGLHILLTIFPSLRLRFPQLRLKVYSSMSLYQLPDSADAPFEKLYRECRLIGGIDLLKPVGKTELASALRQAHVLAFPASYPETSCLAVSEALASGCKVVSSDRGALRETTRGQARLVPWTHTEQFCFDYFEALSQELTLWQNSPQQQARDLISQTRQQTGWRPILQAWSEL